ncbi:MAG: Inositol-1(or 4)-monophosphatase, partial [Dehalococcoidia bacterium]|nr:Inositol-1(or 4)-monophosphatase [Dehalococcoidia bacterium]
MRETVSRSGRSAREVALQAAGEAGEVLMRHFKGRLKVTQKGTGRRNIVTDVDILSEKTIIGVLRKEFPDFGVLSEEAGNLTGSSALTWIIDPLDGTNNYVFGIPFFCITISLVRGRDVLLGVVYEPVRGEFFVAEKDGGAYLNGKPVSVSGKTSLQDSILGYDIGYNPKRGREMLDVVCHLWPQVYGLRAMGSAALSIAYVGCGRLDLYFHRFLYPWDIAAGLAFVSEAGGRVTDWRGRTAGPRNRQIIASNE